MSNCPRPNTCNTFIFITKFLFFLSRTNGVIVYSMHTRRRKRKKNYAKRWLRAKRCKLYMHNAHIDMELCKSIIFTRFTCSMRISIFVSQTQPKLTLLISLFFGSSINEPREKKQNDRTRILSNKTTSNEAWYNNNQIGMPFDAARLNRFRFCKCL